MKLTDIHLNGRQAQILIELTYDNWTTGDLVKKFEIKQPNVSRAVRELKEKGLIEKKSRPILNDERFKPHRITDKGRQYVNEKYRS